MTQTQFAPGRAPATEHQERLTPTSGCRRMRVCCVGTTGLRAPSPTQRCAAATTLIRVPAPTVRRMRRLRARTSAAKKAARRAPTLAKIAGEVSTATSPVLKTNLNRSHKQKECPNWPFFKAGRYVRRYRSQLVLVQLPGGCQHCIRQRQHFWAWPLDAIRRTRGTARASSNSICIHRINRSAATGSPWEKLIS